MLHPGLQVKGAERPPARHGHATCAIREKLFVFGGTSADGTLLNDLWIFDQDSLNWSHVSCYGSMPSPRRGECEAHECERWKLSSWPGTCRHVGKRHLELLDDHISVSRQFMVRPTVTRFLGTGHKYKWATVPVAVSGSEDNPGTGSGRVRCKTLNKSL